MSFRKVLFFLLVISALLLASCGAQPVSVVTTAPPPAPATDLSASLGEVQGTVQVKNPDQADFSAAGNGARLQVQGQVRTGADGRVRLDFSSGTFMRVAPNTIFTLQSNEAADGSLLTRLKLEAGRLWIILHGGRLDVETPSGEASVRGSYLSVWVDPETNDVTVTCLEGWCTANNPAGGLDLVAGQRALLVHWDPAGTVTPPAPQLDYLSQAEIDDFLANNPEAQEVLDKVIATASALPPLGPTKTPVPVVSCFTLTSPADGTALPPDGQYTFDWTEQPGRYKYIISITKPNGAILSQIVWSNTYKLDASSLPLEGAYQWKVTAYDSGIQPICTAGPWTFTKAAGPAPTPVANCFKLLSPLPDAEVPASTPLDLTWEEQPGRYKFVITVTKPDGAELSQILFTNTFQLPAEKLAQGGDYKWQVTAYDSSIKPICSAGPQVFKVAGGEPTPTPGPQPSGCVDLLSPANGTEYTDPTRIDFAWTSYPGAYKYILNVKAPSGNVQTFISYYINRTDYFEAFPEGGTYTWWVTVKDNLIRDICSSGQFTFTKPATTYTPPESGGGGGEGGATGNFWNRGGPFSGTLSDCNNLGFSVSTSLSGMIKVVFSSSGAPTGSDPHIVIGTGPGTGSGSKSFGSGTYYWAFAVYDGTYHFDDFYYSFTCP